MAKPKQGRSANSNKPNGQGKPWKDKTPKEKVSTVVDMTSKIAGGVKTIADIASTILHNHPEWYTHYDTSQLVALNLSTKQEQKFTALEVNYQLAEIEDEPHTSLRMPSVATTAIQFTTPKGDLEGWRSGVRLLYQQIITANSGKKNFTVQQLERYIMNVRALHAINAFLARTYRITYTFTSTNALIPQLYLRACGLDPEDIIANAADLLMYQNRYAQEVKVNFPLVIPFYDRTTFLMSNIFADSDSHKPSFYVPTINRMYVNQLNSMGMQNPINSNIIQGGGLEFYITDPAFQGNDVKYANSLRRVTWVDYNDGKDGVGHNHRFWTYAQLIEQCDYIKKALIDDQISAEIAGDIIKTFGDRAFYNVEVAKIDQTVPIIYDESFMSQLQNCTPVQFCHSRQPSGADPFSGFYYFEAPEGGVNSAGDDIFTPRVWIDGFMRAGFQAYNRAINGVQGDQYPAAPGVREEMNFDFTEKFNRVLLNWHDNKISSGEVLSITRFVATDATMYYQRPYSDWVFNTFGTEVVAGIYAWTDHWPYNLNANVPSPISGWIWDHATTDTEQLPQINAHLAQTDLLIVPMLWANFDWCPRFTLINARDGLASNNTVQNVGPMCLDWDVFSEVDSSFFDDYFSYGNQSILYAGSSQNQSNTKVYKKDTKSRGRNSNANGKREDNNSVKPKNSEGADSAAYK